MQTLGLYIEGSHLRFTLLKSRRGKPELSLFQTIPLSKAGEHVKQFYIQDKDTVVATGLPTPQVVTREIRFNLRSKTTLMTALPFQIESNVPFSPEETIAFTLFKKGKKRETFVTLLACKEEDLDQHISEWSSLNADPSHLSCAPKALHRFAEHFFPKTPSLILFHVGKEHCTYLVIHEGRLNLSGSFPFGVHHFLDALKYDDLPEDLFDDIDITETKTPHLYKKWQQFKQEINRVKTFLERREFGSLPTLLCGHLPTPIAAALEETFPERLSLESKEYQSLLPYAIPFGLALDGHYQDRNSVQFRQNIKASPRWLKRFKKRLITYCSLSLLFTLLLGSMRTYVISSKRAHLENELSTVLNQKVSLEEGIVTIERAAAKSRGFTSNTLPPKVSDVLQWLGTHPLLKKGERASPLEVTRMQYKLEHYPKLGEKSESYLAKVELEIFSSSPTAARDFHNALLKGDYLVDQKREIVWKTAHNAYFTKFYLKNSRQ